jgi:thiosulfate/3-mercaptopyruvate sulfurtransferase
MSEPPLLVSPRWLADHLDDPALRILDATVVLELGEFTVATGRPLWRTGHIPGADHVDLIALSDPDSPHDFTLPSETAFAETMSALGVGPGTHVIAYDARSGAWAARLWWMLRVFGFDAASVLDGGWKAWRKDGHPVSTDRPEHAPARFEASLRLELLATTDQVEGYVADGGARLVNALSPELFRGERSVGYRRPGRIPRSINVPTQTLVDRETSRYLPPDRLRERFADAGVIDADRIVTYCGAGIAATMDAFGLALAGREDVAVYDGSLGEWTADADRQVETGDLRRPGRA